MKALLVLVAVTSVVHADAGAELELRLELGAHAAKIAELRAGLSRRLDGHTVETCVAAIRHARDAGVPGGFEIESSAFANLPTAQPRGTTWMLTLDHARVVCDTLRTWRGLALAQKTLIDAQKLIDWLGLIDKASGMDRAMAEKLAAGAKACSDGIAQLVADGAPTDVPIEVDGAGAVTLRDAPHAICEPLAAAAATFAKDVTSAHVAKRNAIAAPYRAAGITGDRLELLVAEDGVAKYAIGGAELTSPKALAAARVLFEESHDGDIWTVTRFELRGDALRKTTRAQYVLKPDSRAFR